MKKFAWKKCRKMFLEALFFACEKNFFTVSVQNFGHCRLHEIIGLQLSQCLSANHNADLRCVICTGVTLFALVLHFLHWCYTWIALLSANQNRVIFSCVLLNTLEHAWHREVMPLTWWTKSSPKLNLKKERTLLHKYTESAHKNSTLCDTISSITAMFEKHSKGKMTYNTKPATTKKDIQGSSLDLL